MPWPLLGLTRVKAGFSDLLKTKRVPHALLFTGPDGGGKFSLSLALAQALNCQSPDEDSSPCGHCDACRRTANLCHPDIHVLEPKGRLNLIPIDDVRDLRSALRFRAFEGPYKVAIIRGAEHFRDEAGGALLKTLEEPTPNTIIILNAVSEASVMATLVSRCVRVKIPPLPKASIVQALTQKGYAARVGSLLAGLSDGTLGGALKLDPQKTLSVWDELDKLLGHFGAPSALNAAIEWTTVLGSEISKLRKKDDTFPQVQATFEIIIKSLRLWWRDTAVLAVTGDRSRLLGPPPSAAQLAWAEKLTADKLAKLEDSLSRLVDGLGRAMRLEIIFENYWLDVLE